MQVVIVDFGSGNLKSLYTSLGKAKEDLKNINIVVSNDSNDVKKSDKVILPGVGTYSDCKKGLESIKGLRDALEETVRRKSRPFLGICVGMQLMSTVGLENGKTKGLNWIPGQVVPIEPGLMKHETLPKPKIPHMGWNQICPNKSHFLFDGITNERYFYFVHSFHFLCDFEDNVLATVDYHQSLVAIVEKENMLGTQFHPEKSQLLGLKFLSNFLKWKP